MDDPSTGRATAPRPAGLRPRSADVRGRLLLLLCLGDGCALLRPQAPAEEALRARHLMVPVAGVSPEAVPDTFRARRGLSRIHAAVDVPAPRGTAVLSADSGRVLRRHRNRSGGLTLYATDDDGRFVYYYAHLAAYQDGIDKGTRLTRGQVIGWVGTTGNADHREPHLHFQVMVHAADGGWWNGRPIDPRPYFASPGRAR